MCLTISSSYFRGAYKKGCLAAPNLWVRNGEKSALRLLGRAPFADKLIQRKCFLGKFLHCPAGADKMVRYGFVCSSRITVNHCLRDLHVALSMATALRLTLAHLDLRAE